MIRDLIAKSKKRYSNKTIKAFWAKNNNKRYSEQVKKDFWKNVKQNTK